MSLRRISCLHLTSLPFLAGHNDWPGLGKLRRRIVFDHVSRGTLEDERFGTVRIVFRPDGTSETAAIYLQSTGRSVSTLMLDGDTGRVDIYARSDPLEPPLTLYEQYDHNE